MRLEISLEIETRKKNRYKQTVKINACIMSTVSQRDSIRWSLAALLLLLLKFSWFFMNAIFCFYCIQTNCPWVFSFLKSIFRQNISLCHFQVLFSLFSSSRTFCFQFLYSEYRTVWGITQQCSICSLFSQSSQVLIQVLFSLYFYCLPCIILHNWLHCFNEK